jgi:hypothetical protein
MPNASLTARPASRMPVCWADLCLTDGAPPSFHVSLSGNIAFF